MRAVQASLDHAQATAAEVLTARMEVARTELESVRAAAADILSAKMKAAERELESVRATAAAEVAMAAEQLASVKIEAAAAAAAAEVEAKNIRMAASEMLTVKMEMANTELTQVRNAAAKQLADNVEALRLEAVAELQAEAVQTAEAVQQAEAEKDRTVEKLSSNAKQTVALLAKAQQRTATLETHLRDEKRNHFKTISALSASRIEVSNLKEEKSALESSLRTRAELAERKLSMLPAPTQKMIEQRLLHLQLVHQRAHSANAVVPLWVAASPKPSAAKEPMSNRRSSSPEALRALYNTA